MLSVICSYVGLMDASDLPLTLKELVTTAADDIHKYFFIGL